MSCVTTDHAKTRTRERVGLPKKAIERNTERAFLEGIRHGELSGGFKRYVDALYLNERTANNIRIYNRNVYLFCGNVLITVIPLPQKYRKTADNIIKNRAKNGKNTEGKDHAS